MPREPDATNQRVMQLYHAHQLTRPQIAELCRVSRGAVDRWLRPAESPHYRTTPEGSVELLEFKLGLRKRKGGHAH